MSRMRTVRDLRPGAEPLESRRLPATYALAGPELAYRIALDRDASPSGKFQKDLDMLAPADYDGDGRADPAVYRANTARWYRIGADDRPRVETLGAPLRSLPVPADYDGDGRSDLVVFTPSTGSWGGHLSGGNDLDTDFGARDLVDIPVPGDYDGDGRADLAVFRRSTAEWLVAGSTGLHWRLQFGQGDRDVPVPADYDGDGRIDPAVYRPDTGDWFLAGSSGVRTAIRIESEVGDRPVPADYDGDGRADPALFRPRTATWEIRQSQLGPTRYQFGQGGLDVAAPADVDGDGIADFAIARPTTGWWAILGSTRGGFTRTLDPAVIPLVSQSGNWLLRHALNEERVERGGTRLAFYGDSLTYRWGDSERNAVGSDVWRAEFAPEETANFGIDSDVTQGLLWRVRHGEVPADLEVAVIEIGTNNLGPDLVETPAEVARGVKAIVSAIREQAPGVRVLVMGLLPRGASAADPFRAAIRATNAELAALDDGESVRFLDIGDRFVGPDGSLSALLFPDEVHPSLLGYQIWAEAIRGQLNAWLKA